MAALFHTRRNGRLLGGILALLLAVTVAAATVPEYRVKAAFLYNFAKFVDWPAYSFTADTSPLVLCVVGQSPFGDYLEELAGKTVHSHPVQLREVPPGGDPQECHILFISRSEKRRLARLLQQSEKNHVLTVSDIDDFSRSGGMIGLVTEGGRIRFDINAAAVQRAHLGMSSQLLKLARTVAR